MVVNVQNVAKLVTNNTIGMVANVKSVAILVTSSMIGMGVHAQDVVKNTIWLVVLVEFAD